MERAASCARFCLSGLVPMLFCLRAAESTTSKPSVPWRGDGRPGCWTGGRFEAVKINANMHVAKASHKACLDAAPLLEDGLEIGGAPSDNRDRSDSDSDSDSDFNDDTGSDSDDDAGGGQSEVSVVEKNEQTVILHGQKASLVYEINILLNHK